MSKAQAAQDPSVRAPAWLNSLSTPLLLIDAQSRVCALNTACEALLGLSLLQWQALKPQAAPAQAAVLSPEQAAQAILFWLPGAQSLNLNVRMADAPGPRAVQVQAAGPAIDDAGWRCVQLVDNTVLVQALSSAELHDRRFEQLFKNAPMGVLLVELESGVVRQANEQFAAMIGRSLDQVIGQAWRAWTHPDDVAESLNEIERLSLGDTRVAIFDRRFLKPDGELVYVHVTLSPINVAAGQPALILKTVEDIGQRREREAALKRTQDRLRKAERAGKMAL
jgi:PAS domain S-box-containing protein